MIKFVKFDPVTGRILYSGSVPQGSIFDQEGDVLAGTGASETHYVDVTNLKVIEKPPRPSSNHSWDYVDRAWKFDREQCLSDIKRRRNALLVACDWTQLPDAPVKHKAEWETYRQALRDITEQTDIENIIWPIPPQ